MQLLSDVGIPECHWEAAREVLANHGYQDGDYFGLYTFHNWIVINGRSEPRFESFQAWLEEEIEYYKQLAKRVLKK